MSDELEALVQKLQRVTELERGEIVVTIRELGKMQDERVIAPLIHVLGYHESTKVNNAAAQELVKFGEKAVPSLIAALPPNPKHPNDVWRRVWTISALGETRDARAVEPLIQMLNSTDEVRVAESAANAFEYLGDKRAIEPLQKTLDRFKQQKKRGGFWEHALPGAINYLTRRGH
jgi:HEAT repeat protein